MALLQPGIYPFAFAVQVLLLFIDVVCNFLYPAHETLFSLAKFQRAQPSGNGQDRNRLSLQATKSQLASEKFTHWMTYWVFYALLFQIQHEFLYFFPFAYEIRVMVMMLMANPKVEAAQVLQQFVVTNPRIMIMVIDLRNRLRVRLDNEVLPAIKKFRIFRPFSDDFELQADKNN